MKCKDIVFKFGKIELEDDPLGIFDWPLEEHYLQGEEKIVFYKAYGSDYMFNSFHQTDALFYWNFILSQEQFIYERK